jgi:hypothetical protein
VKAEVIGTAHKEVTICNQVEGRQHEFDAMLPRRERDVGSDPGRFAERQCQRSRH